MFKKIFLLFAVLSSLFIGTTCFAAPTETINGAYIGMSKEELLRLPDYQYAIQAKQDGKYYIARETINGGSVGYMEQNDFVTLDKGSCFVYFRDNKVIAIRLTTMGVRGRIQCLKKLDSAGLPCDAKWEDYKNSAITKEYPEDEFFTWLKLHDDTYLTFTGAFGRSLDSKDAPVSGLMLSKYLDPFSEVEQEQEVSAETSKAKEQSKKKEVPIEKKIADRARKVLGL